MAPLHRRCWVLASLLLVPACAGTASRSTAPVATQWIDAPLVGASAAEHGGVKLESLKTVTGRLVRLDRLLDLFDAARFADDDGAREALWLALGGHSSGRGPEATRDAVRLLLEEALAIEAAASAPLSEGSAAFLADAISMLSVDLEHPGSADALSIRALAYRTISEHGHPRVADNATWRIYDHVRGTLAGAVEAPPARRMEIAVHVLYADRDDISTYLADGGPTDSWPTPSALIEPLEAARARLQTFARWKELATRLAIEDAILTDTVAASVPAARDPSWPMPPGTGRPESFAPVVRLASGRADVNAGRRGHREVALGEDVEQLTRALSAALALDGRGTLLLVADPATPAPELAALLRGLRRSQASALEIAVRDADRITALPLLVSRATDSGPSVRAVDQARIEVHLAGTGPRFAIDERALTKATPADLAAAYPRERMVRLTLGPSVSLQQVVDLLTSLSEFAAVAWRVGPPPERRPAHPSHDVILARRARLGATRRTALDQPFPLKAGDQKRLEAFADSLGECAPELESDTSTITVDAAFDGGSLNVVVSKPKSHAFETCVTEQAYGTRLRFHSDELRFKITLTRG